MCRLIAIVDSGGGETTRLVQIVFAIFLLASTWFSGYATTSSNSSNTRLNLPRKLLIVLTALALILGIHKYGEYLDLIWGEVIGAILIINAVIFGLFSAMIRPKRWKLQCAKA